MCPEGTSAQTKRRIDVTKGRVSDTGGGGRSQRACAWGPCKLLWIGAEGEMTSPTPPPLGHLIFVLTVLTKLDLMNIDEF